MTSLNVLFCPNNGPKRKTICLLWYKTSGVAGISDCLDLNLTIKIIDSHCRLSSWTWVAGQHGCSFNMFKCCFCLLYADEKPLFTSFLFHQNQLFRELNVLIIWNKRWKYTVSCLIIRFPKVIHADNKTTAISHRLFAGWNWPLQKYFILSQQQPLLIGFKWNSFHPRWPTPHTLEPDRLLTPNTGALLRCDNCGETRVKIFFFVHSSEFVSLAKIPYFRICL